MEARKYDSITALCLAVAVLSAILFEAAGGLRWIVGALGIGAAVTTAITYICNQWRAQSKGCQADLSEKSRQEPAGLNVNDPVPASRAQAAMGIGFKEATPALPSNFNYKLALLFYDELELLNYGVAEQISRVIGWRVSLDFAGEVVEIVNRLSSAEESPVCEFVLTREGSLIIRPLGKKGRFREKARSAFESGEFVPIYGGIKPN